MSTAIMSPQDRDKMIADNTGLTVEKVVETLRESKLLALRPDSDMDALLAANYVEGDTIRLSDLPRLKVPSGGSTNWTIIDVSGETSVNEVVGVPVVFKPAGTLWPSEEQQEGAKPFLVTHNLKDAIQVSDDFGDLDLDVIEKYRTGTTPDGRGIYDWQKLPYNKFESAGNGRGKRCKENRLICILRPDDLFPLFLRVPPASVNPVGRIFRMLTKPSYQCLMSFTLTKRVSGGGKPYAEVTVVKKEELSKAEGLALKFAFTDRLGAAMQDAAFENEDGSDEDEVGGTY